MEAHSYSSKKDQHSINILLRRKIVYLSRSRFGIQNDINMATQYKEEWSKLFGKNDVILGDEGFKGLDSSTSTSILTMNKSDPQFSSFSSKRIIIENTFARIKRWKSCREVIHTPCTDDLLEEHNKMWVVVSSFVNKFLTGNE